MLTTPDDTHDLLRRLVPVCAIEIDVLRQPRPAPSAAAGSTSPRPASTPPTTASRIATSMPSSTACAPTASVVRGLDVLQLAYGAAGLGWLVAATRHPWLRAPSDAAYRLFARHRHALSRLLAPVLRRTRRTGEGGAP